MSTNVNVEFVITGELFNSKDITRLLSIQLTEQWIRGYSIPKLPNPRIDILKEIKKYYDIKYLVVNYN